MNNIFLRKYGSVETNYLDLFCRLRFLQIANKQNTQQRIRNIMARRTAEMIPIFCVKETGGGIISFSTWSLIVSVLVYKIVLPSRSTWVAMHLQKRWFSYIQIYKKKQWINNSSFGSLKNHQWLFLKKNGLFVHAH